MIALQWKNVDWGEGVVHIKSSVVCKRLKDTKTQSSQREVLLLPPALESLKAQVPYTQKKNEHIFHHPKQNQPWQTDNQIRESFWRPLLLKAGIRYRNPYQTRHTYASTLLSNGENIMWVARQMRHVDIEMIMRTYGKWLPDNRKKAGYETVNDWGSYL